MLSDRRVRLQFDRMTELRFCLLQFTLLKSCPSFRNIELSILVALVGGRKLPSLLDLCCTFFLVTASSQRQTQLVVTFAAAWIEVRCLSKVSNRAADLGVAHQSLAYGKVCAGKVRSDR